MNFPYANRHGPKYWASWSFVSLVEPALDKAELLPRPLAKLFLDDLESDFAKIAVAATLTGGLAATGHGGKASKAAFAVSLAASALYGHELAVRWYEQKNLRRQAQKVAAARARHATAAHVGGGI